MIEAVNSTIANAALVRNVAEQATAARLQSPPPAEERREIALPQAPYVSPYIKVDTEFDTAVLQIRDSATGDVIDQFPRETTLAARQRQEVLRELADRQSEQTAQPRQQASELRSSGSSAAARPAQGTAYIAQEASTSSAPSSSDAQLASAAFASGATSGANISRGVSVTA